MKKMSVMKRLAVLGLSGVMVASLAGCGSSETTEASAESTTESVAATTGEAAAATTEATTELTDIDELSVYFVPSRDPDEIVTATEPLKDLLKAELVNEGYNVENVDISVGTSYEAVGEAMSAGTADVGFIPGGTYVLYDDGADVILTATRSGLSKDSSNAADWNDGQPTEPTDEQVSYYKGLGIAGPTEKGKELADIINSGEQLTYEDLEDANIAVMSSSSSSGYIYPSLWMQDNIDHKLTDLPNLVQSDSYASSFARLASGEIDLLFTYADARRDYADQWTGEWGRPDSIWDETNVVLVTDNIYNDTISVSKNSPKMTDEFKAALQTAFINIANTDEGKEVISIYSHEGYVPAQSSDYDSEREAQEFLREANSN